jgi:hypothetical protein
MQIPAIPGSQELDWFILGLLVGIGLTFLFIAILRWKGFGIFGRDQQRKKKQEEMDHEDDKIFQ